MQYGNTDFTKRLSYGGGGGGGGGNAMPDDPNPGGEGGNGGGLVYLLLDNLTLDGRIESEGTLRSIRTQSSHKTGRFFHKNVAGFNHQRVYARMHKSSRMCIG